MINALVSLNADLASSIAFRYACRLMEHVEMRLQAIHVEEVGKESFPPGSGWVRHTWENGLTQTARHEVAQLMTAEKGACPTLPAPVVRIGEYDDELLKEISEKAYDLLIEGMLNSFHAHPFHKKMRSKLYKYATCPILLVKNLVKPERVALLLSEEADASPVVSTFSRLFGTREICVDLVSAAFTKPGESDFLEKLPGDGSGDGRAQKTLASAQALLAEKGRHAETTWSIRDTAEKISEFLSGYGLVGACHPRSVNRYSAILNLLDRIPSAVLLCKK
jgi:hypothetical protein